MNKGAVHRSSDDQTTRPDAHILGTRVDAMTMDDVLHAVELAVGKREKLLIGVVNAAKLVNMRREEALREAVTSADLVLADGMSVVWASRLLGKSLPERVPGIDLMYEMFKRGSVARWRVFLLGARVEVLESSKQRIADLYPGVVVCGCHHGYFDEDEESAIVDQINATRADVLLVAMSPPKKEIFLAQWADELDVPVRHGVGGALDVLAGRVKRAPEIWRRWGCEWLYRIIQEPRRMWRRYLVTNTCFCALVVGQFIGLVRPLRS